MKGGLLSREYIRQAAIGSVADGLFLVGRVSFVQGTAQLTAQAGSHRDRIVCRPGVIHAGMRHCERTRCLGWSCMSFADGLEGCAVPADHDTFSSTGADAKATTDQ